MKYLIPPWDHQLKAIERAKDLRHFALFFEMGTGKSGTAINILRLKMNAEKRIFRTLIFCPPIVVTNWRDEWKMHSTLDPANVVLLQGSGEKRLKTFMENAWREGNEETDWAEGELGPIRVGKIFVTNYETLLMEKLFEAFMKWSPEALVFDESHKLKDRKSKRSKAAELLANPYDRKKKRALPLPQIKLLLSGSPVLNSPMDLFQQFLVMDGGETFGHNFFIFQARYFRDLNAGMDRKKHFPNWVPRTLNRDGFDAVAEINKLLFQNGMRVMKEECLDLPPLIRQTIKVQMTPEQQGIYESMRQDLIAFMKEKTVVATLAITKALRLMQIASGYIKTVDGDEITLKETPKMAVLKELLEELTPHHKVIVWASWRQNYREIQKVCGDLGIEYADVFGGLTSGVRDSNVDRFKHSERCRVLIGNPGAGGIGINLVVAPYAIFYSRNFSLEHDLQARSRNHRGGSEVHSKITQIDLVCENTIEEIILKKLANKEAMSDALLKDIVLNEL